MNICSYCSSKSNGSFAVGIKRKYAVGSYSLFRENRRQPHALSSGVSLVVMWANWSLSINVYFCIHVLKKRLLNDITCNLVMTCCYEQKSLI